MRKHPGRKQVAIDLEKQARKAAKRLGKRGDEPTPEVIPGIGHRAFVPALGRQVEDAELQAVLAVAEAAKPVLMVPRTDRPGKPRPYVPEAGTQFFHAQLRMDVFLALRWGQQQGLADANPVLDQLLTRVEDELARKYGPGYVVEAVCLHAPNPFLEEELERRGWRVSVQSGEKRGRNNLHLQVYVRRLAKERDGAPGFTELATRDHVFSVALDSVISSAQLAEFQVDLDLHRESRFADTREKSYRLGDEYHRTGKGRKGRPLPPRLRAMVDQGKLSIDEAIAKAVATDLLRKRKSWANAKEVKSLGDMNKMQVARAEKAGAVDLHFARWFTSELDRDLRALDPRYGALIDQAQRVFPELKRREIAAGHKRTFNEILNEWESQDAASRQKADRDGKAAAEERAKAAEEAKAATEREKAELAAKAEAERQERERVEREANERVGALEQQLAAAPKGSPEADDLRRDLAVAKEDLNKAQKTAAGALAAVTASTPTLFGFVREYALTGKIPEPAKGLIVIDEGRLSFAPLGKALDPVIRSRAGTPDQLTAARNAYALAKEVLAFVDTSPSPTAWAKKRAEWAAKYPLPESSEIEQLFEKHVQSAVEQVAAATAAELEATTAAMLRFKADAAPGLIAGIAAAVPVAAESQDCKTTAPSQWAVVSKYLRVDDNVVGWARWTDEAERIVRDYGDLFDAKVLVKFDETLAVSKFSLTEATMCLAAAEHVLEGTALPEGLRRFLSSDGLRVAPEFRRAADVVIGQLGIEAKAAVLAKQRDSSLSGEAPQWLRWLAVDAKKLIATDERLKQRALGMVMDLPSQRAAAQPESGKEAEIVNFPSNKAVGEE